MFQFRKHIKIAVSFTSKIAEDKQTPLIGINSQTENFECMYTVKHTVTFIQGPSVSLETPLVRLY